MIKVIKTTFPDKSNNRKLESILTNVPLVCKDLQKLCIGCFIYSFVIHLICKRNADLVSNPYRISYKLFFIFFSFFLTKQKQDSGFQQVGRKIFVCLFVFCLRPVTLYFKAMPNSVDFYKGIFLHVIPVCVILQ